MKSANDTTYSAGEEEMCVCPKCGYAQQRLAGTKCRTIICPRCKVPLR